METTNTGDNTLDLDQVEARERAELIDAIWPYDGPHSDGTVVSAAAALGELVRYLNNATGGSNVVRTLDFAPTTRRVTSRVATAVAHLDQLTEQLAAAMVRHAADATLVDERGEHVDPADAANASRAALIDARQHLAAAAQSLRTAAQVADPLGHDGAGV